MRRDVRVLGVPRRSDRIARGPSRENQRDRVLRDVPRGSWRAGSTAAARAWVPSSSHDVCDPPCRRDVLPFSSSMRYVYPLANGFDHVGGRAFAASERSTSRLKSRRHSNEGLAHTHRRNEEDARMAAHGALRTNQAGKDVRAESRRRTRRPGRRVPRLAVAQAEARERSVEFKQGVMLSQHSTWGIGGPAKLFVEIFEPEDMVVVLEESVQRDVPLFVLGRGSNCLFDDRGFEGIVALNNMSHYQDLGEGKFRVGSGHRFDHLGVKTSKEGWTGLEFAAGIPGTVGGAVYMNAGANQQQTSDVLVEVEYLDRHGKLHTLKKEEAKFGYRKSPFQEMLQPIVVTSAVFQLRKCDKSRARVMEYMDRRRRTQPLHEKSAGCVFRNPGEGHPPVGYLIERLGMKGLVVGGASVSHVHGNFLISKDGCQCSDMLQLIQNIKTRIKEATGIDLEEEIYYVPPQGFHKQ